MEEKKTILPNDKLEEEELDAVTGGVKRTRGIPRFNYCSTCGKEVTPDDDGCCPNCGKQL